MSRAQWGHGYHKGVEDALNGKIQRSVLEKDILAMLCHMNLSNIHKTYDQSLYPVSELITRLLFAGVNHNRSEKMAKEIYDYVMDKEPYGCYISGYNDGNWREDWFVIFPGFGEQFWLDELEKYQKNRMEASK